MMMAFGLQGPLDVPKMWEIGWNHRRMMVMWGICNKLQRLKGTWFCSIFALKDLMFKQQIDLRALACSMESRCHLLWDWPSVQLQTGHFPSREFHMLLSFKACSLTKAVTHVLSSAMFLIPHGTNKETRNNHLVNSHCHVWHQKSQDHQSNGTSLVGDQTISKLEEGNTSQC